MTCALRIGVLPVLLPSPCGKCCGLCCCLSAAANAAACDLACPLRPVLRPFCVSCSLRQLLRGVLWPAPCSQCFGLWCDLRAKGSAAACVVACALRQVVAACGVACAVRTVLRPVTVIGTVCALWPGMRTVVWPAICG